MQAIWPQILMLCTRQTARGPAHRELVDGRGGEPRRLLPQQAQRFVEVSCRNFSHVQPRLQQLFVGFGSPQVRGRLAEVNGWPARHSTIHASVSRPSQSTVARTFCGMTETQNYSGPWHALASRRISP